MVGFNLGLTRHFYKCARARALSKREKMHGAAGGIYSKFDNGLAPDIWTYGLIQNYNYTLIDRFLFYVISIVVSSTL